MNATELTLQHPSNEYGVLLVNLGTPDAPEPGAIRRYLKEFLSDPRVIDYPKWLWYPILYGAILPLRSRKVAEGYKAVWGEGGSPLRAISERQVRALQSALTASELDIPVELAMTYGNPSVKDAIRRLTDKGACRIVVLPLYPQYSSTTTAAVFDVVANAMKGYMTLPELRFVPAYYHRRDYIAALSDSVKEYWAEHGQGSHLLCSFHGIPQRYVKNGDPYQQHCQHTRDLLAEALQQGQDKVLLSYQSRVGKEQWLKPYTSELLQELPKQGITELDVICPAFSVDCLETLEEIEMENREVFMHAGGKQYRYIPALNDRADHIQLMTALVIEQLQGW